MIGLHLLIDSVMEQSVNKIDIEEILHELPGKIGMKILAGPFIVKGNPENPGWTGFVIIDKSHISIHAFDQGDLISIDVFSCKPFDTKIVTEYLRNKIKMHHIKIRVIERNQA